GVPQLPCARPSLQHRSGPRPCRPQSTVTNGWWPREVPLGSASDRYLENALSRSPNRSALTQFRPVGRATIADRGPSSSSRLLTLRLPPTHFMHSLAAAGEMLFYPAIGCDSK